MNKLQLFEVQFACIINVAARTRRQALDIATRMLDNPQLYPVCVRETSSYPQVLSEVVDPPAEPEPEQEKDEPIPF